LKEERTIRREIQGRLWRLFFGEGKRARGGVLVCKGGEIEGGQRGEICTRRRSKKERSPSKRKHKCVNPGLHFRKEGYAKIRLPAEGKNGGRQRPLPSRLRRRLGTIRFGSKGPNRGGKRKPPSRKGKTRGTKNKTSKNKKGEKPKWGTKSTNRYWSGQKKGSFLKEVSGKKGKKGMLSQGSCKSGKKTSCFAEGGFGGIQGLCVRRRERSGKKGNTFFMGGKKRSRGA